ncbi:MAG TPA: hypothetical protein VFO40_01595 [Chthoniobacterales bacterium]|nr:hypothetical protein [Chthoniobacterales bacterium]
MNILIVCTGNILHSVIAESLLRLSRFEVFDGERNSSPPIRDTNQYVF